MRRRSFARLAIGCAVSLGAWRPASAQDDGLQSVPPSPSPGDTLRSIGEATTVTLDSGDTLAGSLTTPSHAKPPVVLIVPGSGPVDRNGNTLSAGLNTNVYAYLAAGLQERGIASLRYDKRGVGESAGAVTSEADVRFDDYIGDAVKWIEKLQADARFASVGIVGHSEGSLIAMVVATTAALDAFVSLEGAGRPLPEILRAQLGADPGATPNLIAASERIIAALSRGETVPDIPQELAPIFRPSVQPYLISAFKYDPQQAIVKAGKRSGIVQGTADLQVPVSDAKLLAAARPDAALTIVDKMSHVLKIVTGADSATQIRTVYADPALPIAREVPDAIAAIVFG